MGSLAERVFIERKLFGKLVLLVVYLEKYKSESIKK